MNIEKIAESQGGLTVFRRIIATYIDLFTIIGVLCFFDLTLGNEVYQKFVFIILPVALIHPVFLEYKFGGSIGKLFTDLRIVESGQVHVRFSSLLKNHLMRILEVYLFTIVGFISVVTSKRQQRFGNRLSSTFVIPRNQLQLLREQ
jgi:uncharacterized RDD family membrane protein YckC